jgi:RNA polymerase sigma-70 factor (ECF subfamily)
VSTPLSDALLGAASASTAATLRSVADLEERLAKLGAAVRAARPELAVETPAFLTHLAPRLRGAASLEPGPGHVDLYVAFACMQGQGPAVSELRERVRTQAARAARRLRLLPAESEDLQQKCLAAVMVGDGGVAGLSHYTGEGVLDAWLAATAFRIGLRDRDRARRERPAEDGADAAAGWEHSDPELDFIKQRYRSQFSGAFRQALAALPAREKNVLRLYLFSGLNIDQIGACYRVHRATVARWIGAARERLLKDTRASLAQQLGLDESEVDSLVGLLRSQVEVSLGNYLVSAGT